VVIVPLGILAVVKMIPPEVMAERAAAALVAERPVSRTAAVVIAFIWIASIALTGLLAYRYFKR
jgi:hypothetical protein